MKCVLSSAVMPVLASMPAEKLFFHVDQLLGKPFGIAVAC